MIRTDDRATKSDVTAEANITGDCQVVKLQNLRNLLEPLLELCDLLEMVAQLDHRRGLEHPLLAKDQFTVLKRVDVALDEEQIRAGLDRQEATARNVHSVAVLEVLDGCTGSSLQLRDSIVKAALKR